MLARRVGLARRDERGIAATIVLFPLFSVLVLMLVQGAFWQVDRQAARAAADHASASVALFNAPEGPAVAEAEAMMRAAGLTDVSVTVSRGDGLTVVVASGRAAGILPGMSVTVTARSATPTEALP